MYIRSASLAYNIYETKYVHTFPVLLEITELRVDFGIVVLSVRSNWGWEYVFIGCGWMDGGWGRCRNRWRRRWRLVY
ncbi:hypothetical protein BDP27DRAFT_1340976, partial [Rhodocollybia butyracea]